MKLPSIELDVPRPRRWDLIAAAVLILGLLLTAVSWRMGAGGAPGTAMPTSRATLLALLQLGVCGVSLLLLGKTAGEGTVWGNLTAVGGLLVGLSGALLAATLWAAA